MRGVITQTSLDAYPVRRGKVRDVYDLGDRLLVAATDRISAYDSVLPTGIPDKGRVLTALSLFWFDYLEVANHLITADVREMDVDFGGREAEFEGRSMLVVKAEVVPIECVVRGYLAGSGWREYRETGRVCGIELPAGLVESSKLSEPVFTPATKAESGHDENVSFERTAELAGRETAEALRRGSLEVYEKASEYAARRGIIISDTKFEWGRADGELILIDEVLTPDSSRFWPADLYEPGGPQPSYDKQYVRDWLDSSGWDHSPPAPELPRDVVTRTREKYVEAYQRLTGRRLAD